MIEQVTGNLLKDNADVLVNPVNIVGVMGKGLALQFKRAFPENYKAYRSACQRGELQAGSIFAVPVEGGRWVVNLPTKRHWKNASRLEDVAAGLDSLVEFLHRTPVDSVAVPPLGAGNGGLAWPKVRELILAKLKDLDVTVRLYQPGTPPAEDMRPSPTPPKLTQTHRFLLAGLREYMRQSWDAGIAMSRRMSLVEAHKVAYFMQRGGLELSLPYSKGHFGPYSAELDRFFSSAEGHFLRGYGDGTGGARADLWILPDGDAEAESVLNEPEFLSAWEQVSKHIYGYEYPDGMELLASIDYVCRGLDQSACTLDEVRTRLGEWNARKKRVFAPDQIEVALERLVSRRLVGAG